MRGPPWTTLVAAEELRKALTDPVRGLVVLDVRHNLKDPEAGPRAYAAGHLPGALHAHIDRDLSGPVGASTGRHPLPDRASFAAACHRWGIDAGSQVVAYDDVGGAWAARVWWLLRDAGLESVAVLDGGIASWTSIGGPWTTEVAIPKVGTFQMRPGGRPRVDAGGVLAWRGRMLDARAAERYRGDVEPIDPVAGHIPGAVNAPHGGNLGPDGRFLPPADLRRRYEALLGDVPPSRVAVYCGSGVTASYDLLAMEVAGLQGAALYPGSWSEWIRDPTRPVRRGSVP